MKALPGINSRSDQSLRGLADRDAMKDACSLKKGASRICWLEENQESAKFIVFAGVEKMSYDNGGYTCYCITSRWCALPSSRLLGMFLSP